MSSIGARCEVVIQSSCCCPSSDSDPVSWKLSGAMQSKNWLSKAIMMATWAGLILLPVFKIDKGRKFHKLITWEFFSDMSGLVFIQSSKLVTTMCFQCNPWELLGNSGLRLGFSSESSSVLLLKVCISLCLKGHCIFGDTRNVNRDGSHVEDPKQTGFGSQTAAHCREVQKKAIMSFWPNHSLFWIPHRNQNLTEDVTFCVAWKIHCIGEWSVLYSRQWL